MTDLQSWLYFSNRWMSLNDRFDISIDGHTDKDQSNKGFLNLKNGLQKYCLMFKNYSIAPGLIQITYLLYCKVLCITELYLFTEVD